MNKYAYLLVTEQGNPVLFDYRVPVYWLKRIADNDAKHYGARVVRIPTPKEQKVTNENF